MKRKILVVLLPISLFALFSFAFLPRTVSETQSEVDKVVGYLKFQPQDPWTAMALAANGEANIDLSGLQSVPDSQKSATTYAKYILALTANGKNPTNFGQENYVEKLKGYFNNNQFGDENLLNDDAWAILALGSIGQENLAQVQKAKDFILSHQNSDGGWGYNVGGNSDTNDTSSAIMALLEAGIDNSSSAIQKAVAYLKTSQNDDAGFSYSAGSLSDSCSDSWVMSAIYKLGQDPSNANWLKNNKTVKDSLLSLQDTEGGFWWQTKGDNKFCSAFAAVALLHQAYPVQSKYNLHNVRIEGAQKNICDSQVYGGTAMDLIIAGAKKCGYAYSISEYPGMGLYLAKINDEVSWMYLVNNLSPEVGADSYYLTKNDEALWYAGDWLEQGWFATKLVISQIDNGYRMQAQFFASSVSAWQDLQQEGVKIKLGDTEMQTDSSGKVEIDYSILADGLYDVFVEQQIINGKGYIRSAKQSLKKGIVPSGHQVSLKVDIEQIQPPLENDQSVISFSVTPDTLDFGKLKPGQSAVSTLDIANGSADIYLEAEVNGAGVFKDNLAINSLESQDFSLSMQAGENKNLPVKLNIPANYNGDFGSVEGELTFWATKQ